VGQRQAARAGTGLTPLDNAFAAGDGIPPCRWSATAWAWRRSMRRCVRAGPAAAPVATW